MDFDPLPEPTALLSFIALTGVQFPATFSFSQIVSLCIAVVTLLISAFVSGSEISCFSLTPAQTEELENSRRGERVLELLQKPERMLATILIANNLVNVTIVILLNHALGPIFSGMSEVWSFVLQTVLLTFLILLFGEILPKLYANTYPVKWILAAEPGLRFLVAILRPLTAVLVGSSTIVNKVVVKKTVNLTADDLSQALEITDVGTSDEKEMLEGILRFGDTTAAEVMTPRVDITSIEFDDSFDEVMETVIDSGYSRLPVTGESQDDIKGVLYSRDLLPFIGKDPSTFDWHTLIRETYFVPESRTIDDLMEDFRKRHIHMAIVIDEYGGTEGLVTLEDVLEEIVGDINDEYDTEEKTYRRLPDNTYIFEGKTLLGDFFKVTGLEEEEYADVTEDCETLAGMLLAIKGDFPKEKEPMVFGKCRFLVLDIQQHRIMSVRVKVMDEVQHA